LPGGSRGLGDVYKRQQRDLLDSTRATAPLVCPEGATRIDNTHLPLVEVVAQVKALIQSMARPA
jgi:cytidylate kinase